MGEVFLVPLKEILWALVSQTISSYFVLISIINILFYLFTLLHSSPVFIFTSYEHLRFLTFCLFWQIEFLVAASEEESMKVIINNNMQFIVDRVLRVRPLKTVNKDGWGLRHHIEPLESACHLVGLQKYEIRITVCILTFLYL